MQWQIQSIPTLDVYAGALAIPTPVIALDVYVPGPPYVVQCTITFPAYPVASFQIWKAIFPGAFLLFATVSSASTLFFDNNAGSTGEFVSYKIRYDNGAEQGPYSNTVTVELVP